MADRVFVDTNVLVYADDDDAGPKRDRARVVLAELIPSGRAVVSTQVLLRCASAAGCTRVLTEDLSPGRVIDGVRVDDPFATAS